MAVEQIMVAIRPGDQTEFVNNYPASVNGGTVRWDYTSSSGSTSYNAHVNLSLDPDGHNLTGTVATTSRSPSTGTSTGTVDVSCFRLRSQDAPTAQVPGPDASSDIAAIADFFDAASGAARTATAPTSNPAAATGERRWVLVQTLVNPKNAPTEAVDHTARFAKTVDRVSRQKELLHRIVAQRPRVVAVRVAARQPKHALSNKVQEGVHNLPRLTLIAQSAGQSLCQTETAIQPGQQHRAAIHARPPLVESSENRSIEKLWKDNTLCGRIRHR